MADDNDNEDLDDSPHGALFRLAEALGRWQARRDMGLVPSHPLIRQSSESDSDADEQ